VSIAEEETSYNRIFSICLHTNAVGRFTSPTNRTALLFTLSDAERKIMRRMMKRRIIKGSGGVMRESSFIVSRRKQEMYRWL